MKERVFSDGLGLGQQATDTHPSQNKGWIRAWTQPTPTARSKTPPRPLREAFRMGSISRESRPGSQKFEIDRMYAHPL